MNLNNPEPAGALSGPILIVDDEKIVLVALRDLLLREGYSVMTCSCVVDALTLVNQQPFAVVITDQQMPQLTGLEFLAEVKRLQPDCFRLLITAVLDLNTVIDAINKAEIYRFVLKPWQRGELLETVRGAIDRYQQNVQNHRLLQTLGAQNEALERKLKALEEALQRRGNPEEDA